MATIKIYTNQKATPITMENTGSLTLSDVQSHLQSEGVNTSDSKYVVRANKLELSYSDSVVPAGDQIIMVSPAKTKAGGLKHETYASVQEALEKIETLEEQIEALREEFAEAIETLRNFNPDVTAEDRAIFAELNNL